ncbi:trimeric intracellular cation channel family protein [Amnibacterium flavum]|uniref:Glycine transporter domain-containing protein n=1 Tax=Amnibacterium flavum TaxID=2173173 RepID=A0A2V1HR48_9MICO|nr:TRIC cation channel family protein [Amnibacterium flavum]PVZ94122.1 hypothetical protein DDQ50_10255 [Amnibacterium flavum]
MTPSFSIPLWTDLLAVAIGGVQGALYASQLRERRLDLLGVAIVGTATGLGGGLLRDIFLGVPPVAFGSNWYLPVAVAAAIVGMLLQQVFSRLDFTITALDALTIGLFGAIGTSKALSLGLPVIPAVFIGTVSAVGGGVVRDLLLGLPVALMHVGSLYAVAAGVGTVLLVAVERFGAPIQVAAIVCVVATTAIRLLAVRYGWSLPEQRALAARQPRR